MHWKALQLMTVESIFVFSLYWVFNFNSSLVINTECYMSICLSLCWVNLWLPLLPTSTITRYFKSIFYCDSWTYADLSLCRLSLFHSYIDVTSLQKSLCLSLLYPICYHQTVIFLKQALASTQISKLPGDWTQPLNVFRKNSTNWSQCAFLSPSIRTHLIISLRIASV